MGPNRLAGPLTSFIPLCFQSLPKRHFRDSFDTFIAKWCDFQAGRQFLTHQQRSRSRGPGCFGPHTCVPHISAPEVKWQMMNRAVNSLWRWMRHAAFCLVLILTQPERTVGACSITLFLVTICVTWLRSGKSIAWAHSIYHTHVSASILQSIFNRRWRYKARP